jgi:hypothetical protein
MSLNLIISEKFFKDFEFSKKQSLSFINKPSNLLLVLREYLFAESLKRIPDDTICDLSLNDGDFRLDLTLVEETETNNEFDEVMRHINYSTDNLAYTTALNKGDFDKVREIYNKHLKELGKTIEKSDSNSETLEAEKETTFFTYKIPIKKIEKEKDLLFYEKELEKSIDLFLSSLKEDNLFEF